MLLLLWVSIMEEEKKKRLGGEELVFVNNRVE
jgi:hypothetical protein